jgi:hypothetical protein
MKIQQGGKNVLTFGRVQHMLVGKIWSGMDSERLAPVQSLPDQSAFRADVPLAARAKDACGTFGFCPKVAVNRLSILLCFSA